MFLNAFNFFGALLRTLLSSMVSCEVQGKLVKKTSNIEIFFERFKRKIQAHLVVTPANSVLTSKASKLDALVS